MSSIEPFNRLVKLAARAFYDDFTTKGDNQGHRSSDNRGITVVVLDALCRRQWVREEDLAKDLKLHSKQLRRTLQFFEEEKLVTRNHRKTKALSDGTKQGEEKIKLHTQSYCCLEYAQIYDVVRYKLHRMKKKLKDELEGDKTVQEYVCPNPNCGKRYNAFDAMLLISIEDGCFRCQTCNKELIVAESDNNLALNSHKVGVGVGDGDSNAIRTQKRREKLKDMLRNMEVQLKPLIEQINRVKELPAPQFGTLQDWEAREFARRRLENGESSAIDPSKPSHWYGGTKVEVDFGSQGEDNDIKSEADTTSLKVMPPWMIMQGMKLTKEQRGDVEVNQNQEAITKIDGPSLVVGPEYSDDKTYKDEYVKAFCAAVAAKLQEQQQEEAAKNRQVGMKSKRNDEGDDNLNVEEDATAEDEDDIDWEE